MRTGIIAFCGSKGAGKSTSANMLTDLFQGETEELAFAAHLKNVCSDIFKLNMSFFIDPSLKEKELESYIKLDAQNLDAVLKAFNVKEYDYDKVIRPHLGQVFDTPRRLLQFIGTNFLHPIDPLIHVKMTLENKDPQKLSIITDLRFRHEFDYCKSFENFLPVFVSNRRAELAASGDTHPSEREITLFKNQCVPLDNNSDLSSLRKNVKEVMERYCQ